MDNQERSKGVGLTKNVILFILSLVVALVLAEALTRLFVPVRNVGALFTVNDPVMGKRIKKNFHTVRVTPEFTMTFTSNSLGFRGPEPDPQSTNSILFIGDSFTMGFGVNDGEEFPALIKVKLDEALGRNAVNVVNTGMGNNGNGRWIKLLNNEADQFKPRLVVLQVMANDFEDNVKEGYFSVSNSGTLSELPIKTSKVKFLEPFLDNFPGLSNSYFYSLIRQSLATYSDIGMNDAASREGVDYADRLTERLIAEAVSICQKKGYPVFAIMVGLEDSRLSRIQAIFHTHQVPTLVIPTKTERADLYYKIDGHWNREGHAFVARALFEQLQSLNFTQKLAERGSVVR
ncbi:MAG: GDSL-type esterase/lipase family protein [Pseudomonadota bacterium]